MGNQPTHLTDNSTLPWYDDRIKTVSNVTHSISRNTSRICDTPKKIYSYLDKRVWKQDAAKRAAAILAYNSLYREVKENAMFIGPTGCGKTYIWRCLQELFPDRIEIVDGSNITADGWKGEKKWSTLLDSPIICSGDPAILVIDESDKMLAPKYSSHSENVSQSIAAEGLKMMEGTIADVKSGSFTYQVDTSRISFVLCGAFSNKANEIARDSNNGSSIGFGATPHTVKAYDQPLTTQDLTLEDYYRIVDSGCGPVRRVQEQYKVEISMTKSRRRELAEDAFQSGLGVRGMENRIRQLVDDAIFDDCNRQSFEL